MEQPYRNEEEVIKEIVKGAGLQKPSANFLKEVMEHVEAKSKSPVYTPLIPTKGWLLLILLFLGCLIGLYLYPPSFWDLSEAAVSMERFSFPELHLSKVMLYGIGFLSLFLLQVPFLKRYLERSL